MVSKFDDVIMIQFFMNFYFTHKLLLNMKSTFCFDFGLVREDFCMILTANTYLVC